MDKINLILEYEIVHSVTVYEIIEAWKQKREKELKELSPTELTLIYQQLTGENNG